MEKTFDDMMTDQVDIRNKLIEIMKIEKISIRPVSAKIGISHTTLRKFILQKMNIGWTPICKIVEYCARHNK